MIDMLVDIVEWLFIESQKSALASIIWTVITTAVAAAVLLAAKNLVWRWIPKAMHTAMGKYESAQAELIGRATRIAYEPDQTRLLMIMQSLQFRVSRLWIAYMCLLIIQGIVHQGRIGADKGVVVTTVLTIFYLGLMVFIMYRATRIQKLIGKINEIYDERLSSEGKLGGLSEKPIP